MLKLKSKIFTL